MEDHPKPEPDDALKIDVRERMKDGRTMEFALLSKDPTPEELRQFLDFLNGDGEFAGDDAGNETRE